MEALKRYRSRGEQLVRVERVTVNEGGQAIVGPVTHGARGSSGNHPLEMRVFLPKSSALFGNLDAHARAMQDSRGAGLDRMPLPRCARWSAQVSSINKALRVKAFLHLAPGGAGGLDIRAFLLGGMQGFF
jgi:hypothetical protein